MNVFTPFKHLLMLAVFLLPVLAPSALAASEGSTCRTLNRAEIDAVTTISPTGDRAEVALPADACDVQISFSSYTLPSGAVRPFEAQQLFDNQTQTASGGQTEVFHVDLPSCAWQTDVYLGAVFPNLIPDVGHPSDILLDWAVNEGTPCSTGTEDCADLDFETNALGADLPAGTIVDNEFDAYGITVTTLDPANHPAMIFDTANPTGGDSDLATPGNGPGNDTALGKVLILSEDGDASDPDDDARGGTFVFTFADDTEVLSVGLLDIDADETVTVTAFDGSGGVIASTTENGVGNAGFQRAMLAADGVRRLEVALSSSGALADLDLACEDDICEAIDVDLLPIGSTTIPAQGGRLTFKVTVTNNTDDVCPIQGWLIENMPDGSVANPAKGPVRITLQPGQMFMRTLRFRVGSNAQTGDYFCEGAIGTFPDALATDGFAWTKLGGSGQRPGAASRTAGFDGDVVLLDAATGEPVDDVNWLAPAARSETAAEGTTFGSYPNPFSSSTTVEYAVREASPVTLRVYDLTGRTVATLVEGVQEAGTHQVSFDGRDLAAGTYLYRLQVGDETRTHRVVLTR